MGKIFNLLGQRFGRLTVVSDTQTNTCKRDRIWLCKCDCGEFKNATSSHLRHLEVTSCGCYQREIRPTLHRTHGMSNTPEYGIWLGMKNRCRYPTNKKYSDYGGRGITYSPEWESFEAFFKCVGKRPSSQHSLDRINNNGNYEPGNVKWATPKEQAANRRNKRLEQFSTEELLEELKRRELFNF